MRCCFFWRTHTDRQLCALRLEDIDWRMNLLHIPGAKGGRDVLLPLRSAAGEAIVEYLKRGRPSLAVPKGVPARTPAHRTGFAS